MKKVWLAGALVGLVLAMLLLGTTEKNGGCLPWQQRVGYGDGKFGPEQDVSRCAGNWLPFGSVILPVVDSSGALEVPEVAPVRSDDQKH
jgi:hypothetical protein